MKRYNICVKKTYIKNEEEKATWPSVGTLTYFPPVEDRKAGYKLELPIFGLTQFYVFEIEPKDAPKQTTQETIAPEDVPY